MTAAPDGGVIGSASFDGTARLWAPEGLCLAVFQGKGSVNSIRFGAGSRFAATASSDGIVCLWKVPTAPTAVTAAALTRGSAPNTVALPKSPDSMLPFAADSISSPDRSDDEALMGSANLSMFAPIPVIPQPGSAFEIAPTAPAQTFREHSDCVVAADWLAGQEKLVSGSWDSTLRVWDCSSCQAEQTIKIEFPTDALDHPHLTNIVAHPISQWHVIGPGTDGLCRVWDLRAGVKLSDLLCHSTERAPATHALFSCDGGLILTGGDDRSVKVWDARNTQTPLESIRCGANPARFTLSRHTSTLAIPMQDRKTKVCDTQGVNVGKCDSHKHGHKGMLTCALWSDDETLLYTSSLDEAKSMEQWKLQP